jgi:hypothetical protein
VTVIFRANEGSTIVPVLYKGALDYGAHMAADGIALRNLPGTKPAGEYLFMTLKGLTPGKHRIVTYHNELGDREPAPLTITVGKTVKAEQLMPSKRATNDYEAASACFEVEVAADQDVLISFAAHGAGPVINGFEIDTVDPHKKAIKPMPANDDEHAPPETALRWTAPTSAVAHHFYLGTDSNVIATATQASGEFKGILYTNCYVPLALDTRHPFFWRVDEIDSAGAGRAGDRSHQSGGL